MDDIQKNIVCMLCNDYLVDAVILTECLHFFCRTCLLRHLKEENRCPKCFQNLGNDLEAAFRRDRTLQNLVYKLVPDLFWRQLKRRRIRTVASKRRGIHSSERRLNKTRQMASFAARLCAADEKVSIAIEYVPLARIIDNHNDLYSCKPSTSFVESQQQDKQSLFKRYFRCSAQVRIKELRKLMEYKLAMCESYLTYFVSEDLTTVFDDELTLQDLIYIYTWNRKAPLCIYFTLARAPALDDEDKPPVLDAEILPKLTDEPSPAPLSIKNSKSKSDGESSADRELLSPPPPIDAELLPSIPRLSVSLSTSAFSNAVRGGAHPPIITTCPMGTSNLVNAISSPKLAPQQRKRKKISIESEGKPKKICKKSLPTPTSMVASSSTLRASSTSSDDKPNSISSGLESSKETPASKQSPPQNSKQQKQQSNPVIEFNNQTKSSSMTLNTLSSILPHLNTPKLPRKLKVAEQLFQQQQLKHLQQQQQQLQSKVSSNRQPTKNIKSSLLVKPLNFLSKNPDNICSSSRSTLSNLLPKIPVTKSSPNSLSTTLASLATQQNDSGNGADFPLISSQQQQEAAVRAYYQLMKMTQNDPMATLLNSTGSPPFASGTNIYTAMAAAASNNLFAALCKQVSPTLNKQNDPGLFPPGNNNIFAKKKSTELLQQELLQQLKQQKTTKLPAQIVKKQSQQPTATTSTGKKKLLNNAKHDTQKETNPALKKIQSTGQEINAKSPPTTSSQYSFTNKAPIRLSSIGAAPLLATSTSNQPTIAS